MQVILAPSPTMATGRVVGQVPADNNYSLLDRMLPRSSPTVAERP